jgi:NTE family protein
MTAGLAIALGGGGARAAYQAGVLRRLGREFPNLRPAILVGESAGAINAAYLAAHPGGLREASDGLARLWSQLTPDRIFRVEAHWLIRNAVRWGLRLLSGGWRLAPEVRGLLDTAPLRSLLEAFLGAMDGKIVGIGRNLEAGNLQGIALTTIDYATGETVTWVQGCRIEDWERPHRRSVKTRLTVDHVMASAALPLVFPAVELGGSWHGDGGVRLHAPLSPAVHLGASKILAISTRWRGATSGSLEPASKAYPPLAQLGGVLLNAVFLDLMDQDVLNLQRVNGLLRRIPPRERTGLRPIDLVVVRPSQDLGRLAQACESCLPRGLRFMTRGLGTREASRPDLLSLLMFEPGYLQRLIEIGEADAQAHMPEIAAILEADEDSADIEPVDPYERADGRPMAR